MDFSTNHYSVVFYFVWFVLAFLCKRWFVLTDGSEVIIAVLAVLNAILFSGIHVRRSTVLGFGLSTAVNIVICMTVLGIGRLGMVPWLTMPVACFTTGAYFALDADFYYGEDVATKWLYGAFLVLCAKSGISLIWGIFCSLVCTFAGWIHSQNLDGINMTVSEALSDKENLEVSMFLSAMDSIPLYAMGLFGFMHVHGVDIFKC